MRYIGICQRTCIHSQRERLLQFLPIPFKKGEMRRNRSTRAWDIRIRLKVIVHKICVLLHIYFCPKLYLKVLQHLDNYNLKDMQFIQLVFMSAQSMASSLTTSAAGTMSWKTLAYSDHARASGLQLSVCCTRLS